MSESASLKRLYKSRTERMIDGVCGGIARYFNLDPTLVRIAWVLLTLLGGSGILLYIVAMIVMPKEPYSVPNVSGLGQESSEAATASGASPSSKKNSIFWGVILIGVGLVLFLHNMGFSIWHPFWWFDRDLFLPVLLILAGVAFLWGGRNSLSSSADQPQSDEHEGEDLNLSAPRRLYRSFTESKLFGVCGGLADYFKIDPTIVRILFIVGAFASGGLVLAAYVILAIVLPKEVPTFKTS